MEAAKQTLRALVFGTFLTAVATVPPVQSVAEPQEEIFSIQGTLTDLNAEEKIFRVKNEAGLELTFRANEATVVTAGEAVKSFTDLEVDQGVVIDYLYDENYEKVARRIKVSSEKNPTPAT